MALVAITAPFSISAQSIPRIAVEVAAGSGPHSERSGEMWFRDTLGGILRAGASIRVGTIGEYAVTRHFAVLAEWRYLDLEYVSGQKVSYRPMQAGVRVY